jgi:hypothetical protein
MNNVSKNNKAIGLLLNSTLGVREFSHRQLRFQMSSKTWMKLTFFRKDSFMNDCQSKHGTRSNKHTKHHSPFGNKPEEMETQQETTK